MVTGGKHIPTQTSWNNEVYVEGGKPSFFAPPKCKLHPLNEILSKYNFFHTSEQVLYRLLHFLWKNRSSLTPLFFPYHKKAPSARRFTVAPLFCKHACGTVYIKMFSSALEQVLYCFLRFLTKKLLFWIFLAKNVLTLLRFCDTIVSVDILWLYRGISTTIYNCLYIGYFCGDDKPSLIWRFIIFLWKNLPL